MKTKLLTCTICNTEIKVPLCCKKEMQIQDGVLICDLCNSEQDIPICCGNAMMAVNP
jgi:hypothetical protein